MVEWNTGIDHYIFPLNGIGFATNHKGARDTE